MSSPRRSRWSAGPGQRTRRSRRGASPRPRRHDQQVREAKVIARRIDESRLYTERWLSRRRTWSPDSWRERTALQQPEWPDAAAAAAALRAPEGEPAARLRRRGAAAPRQPRAACSTAARSCCRPATASSRSTSSRRRRIREKLKIMLQMSAVLTYGATLPVVKVGRIAGQFTKPRSEPFERVGDVELPSFRGHMVHDDAPTRRGARPRSGADGRGLQPVGVDAQPAARVHEGRLRRPDPGAPLEPGVRRLELAEGRRYERLADEIERALQFMAACGIDLSRRAPAARGRLLHEPRGPAARLRGGADAPRLADRRLVRLLGAPALDRRAHAAARRRARRVLLRRPQPARRQARPGGDARRGGRAVRAAEPGPRPRPADVRRADGRRATCAELLPPLLRAVARGGPPGRLGVRPDAREHDHDRRTA